MDSYDGYHGLTSMIYIHIYIYLGLITRMDGEDGWLGWMARRDCWEG